MYDKVVDDVLYNYLFIPTGAYPRELRLSGALSQPTEEDLVAIRSFIDAANSLLPDDGMREKAKLKLEDMHFVLRSLRSFTPAPYYEVERKVRSLPPSCRVHARG